jgi:multiple sugar transport system permease protein
MMGGYNMLLYMAALKGVPKDLYEAAEIDGADGWHKFWSITWPMISPTTFFIAIMAVIGGFQGGFMQAYIMTGGGPDRSTTTLEYLIYNHLYSWQHVGYAAGIAWFVFIVVFIITVFNWKFGGRLVHY